MKEDTEGVRAVEGLLKRAIEEGRKNLTEPEAKSIAGALGIAVPEGEVVGSPEDAIRVAEGIGYPVVLKAVSPGFVHKSELGAVRVDIRDAQSLRQAWASMVEGLEAAGRLSDTEGFLVEAMAPQGGVEVIVGTIRDEQFGPVVMFGTGGVAVEVFRDVSYRLAPLDSQRARAMIKETRGHVLLEGYRGRPVCNMEGLVDVMVRLSGLLYRLKELEGFEINPLMLYKDDIIAVDAKATLNMA